MSHDSRWVWDGTARLNQRTVANLTIGAHVRLGFRAKSQKLGDSRRGLDSVCGIQRALLKEGDGA